jgi:hypothetical protein
MTPISRRFALFALIIFPLAILIAPTKLLAQATPTVAGKWLGSFDIVHEDGSVEPDDAYFSFTQTGAAVTGTVGNSPAKQSPIADGKVAGSDVTFSMSQNPGLTVKFNLTLEGDHLRGMANGLPLEGDAKIVIDMTRADDAWHNSIGIVHAPDQLFATIAAQDKKLFDAYNACDLKTLGDIVTEDLEFYHDKTGLAVGRVVFLEAIKNNICGKVQRTLVPGSLEVYRLNHYGAVEIGVHRFHHPDDPSNLGEAKFVTIWQNKDGKWKVSRVISYDHEPVKQ